MIGKDIIGKRNVSLYQDQAPVPISTSRNTAQYRLYILDEKKLPPIGVLSNAIHSQHPSIADTLQFCKDKKEFKGVKPVIVRVKNTYYLLEPNRGDMICLKR